jgi:hypothetical protein
MKALELKFHGRILDSLGIQMYQSPVAALAELVANAWDANATEVDIVLPKALNDGAVIVVKDNGDGMTFQECQDNYLNVGRNRRVGIGAAPAKRPILGRKGIGKLAGFGIADILEVDTTSGRTGERTVFSLDIKALRDESFVSTSAKPIKTTVVDGPDASRQASKGTTITLRALKLSQRPNPERFAQSMSRRFLLNQVADDFKLLVNSSPIPEDTELAGMQFDFPRDYRPNEIPVGVRIEGDWAIEEIGGEKVEWRVRFAETPIGTDEFRGIAIFCGPKVAQTPFFFNLSGSLDGQHGQQYISGIVKADFIDHFSVDLITTERQRINWEMKEAKPLEQWGQMRTKSLLTIWKDRRAEAKARELDDKVGRFSERLNKLPSSERQVVSGAIRKLAQIAALEQDQFASLAEAILTAWEGGRLQKLIERVADVEDMTEGVLLTLLAETQILTALHTAEAVRAKLDVITGLRERIEKRELENAVRDYIAEHPWLMSPEWETFRKERRIAGLVDDALGESGIAADVDWQGRADLVMSAGHEILVVEFMRPGLTLDYDHIDRFARYVRILREKIKPNTALGFNRVSGLLVADNVAKKPGMSGQIEALSGEGMDCLEWRQLLSRAEAQWAEFLGALGSRTPKDSRLAALQQAPAAEDASACLQSTPPPSEAPQ